MRKYLVASLIGHVGITLVGSVLSLSLVSPPPAFTTMKVNLQSMTLPEVDEPEAVPEAPATPPPETAPVEETPPPREIPSPPPDLQRPPRAVEPDVSSGEPEPEYEVDLRPPEPELPPVPEPATPETTQPEDVDFPEPEEVAPRETTPETPPPAPVEAEAPEPEIPRAAAPVQSVGRGGAVQATASEGVDDYYLALVQRKIGVRWQPTPASTGGRSSVEAVVAFRIGPGGEVIAPAVAESSGLTVFDRQALRVVIESAPLPKPPPRFARTGLEIRFRFLYNPEG